MGLWRTIGAGAYQTGNLWAASLPLLYNNMAQLTMNFDFALASTKRLKTAGLWVLGANVYIGFPDQFDLDSSIANLAIQVTLGVDIVQDSTVTWQMRLTDNDDATAVSITDDGYYQASYVWPSSATTHPVGLYAVGIYFKSTTGGALGEHLDFSRTFGTYGPDCFAGCILT